MRLVLIASNFFTRILFILLLVLLFPLLIAVALGFNAFKKSDSNFLYIPSNFLKLILGNKFLLSVSKLFLRFCSTVLNSLLKSLVYPFNDFSNSLNLIFLTFFARSSPDFCRGSNIASNLPLR